MRLPRSPLFVLLLIIVLLASITGAGWATTWTGSVLLWILSGAIAFIMFAALLRDSD
jgi:membrane associated rhomboid family serine protease